jgi:hypothetical protein
MSWLAWAALAYACGAVLTGLYIYSTFLAPINTAATIRNAALWPVFVLSRVHWRTPE